MSPQSINKLRHHISPLVWLFVISIVTTLAIAGVQRNTTENANKALIASQHAAATAQKKALATTRQNQLHACMRGNALRRANNQNVEALRIQRSVLAHFLGDAERARRAAGTPTDIVAANKYHVGLACMAKVSYVKFNIPKCSKIVADIK